MPRRQRANTSTNARPKCMTCGKVRYLSERFLPSGYGGYRSTTYKCRLCNRHAEGIGTRLREALAAISRQLGKDAEPDIYSPLARHYRRLLRFAWRADWKISVSDVNADARGLAYRELPGVTADDVRSGLEQCPYGETSKCAGAGFVLKRWRVTGPGGRAKYGEYGHCGEKTHARMAGAELRARIAAKHPEMTVREF